MSKSAYGTPVVIRDGGEQLALERVPVASGPYNERFIQELAFDNPSCLPTHINQFVNVFRPRILRMLEDV